MNTNNHHIDELFARELGNIEIEPPQSVWQAIEQKLDKKKRIGLLYFRIGLAAGFALLFSLSGVYWYNHSSRKDNIVVASKDSSKEFTAPSNHKNQANTATVNTGATGNNSIEPVQTSYKSNTNQTPVTSDKQITNEEKLETLEDRYTQANDNSHRITGSATEQYVTLAYLEPKPALVASAKPEDPFEEEFRNSSFKEIPAGTQLANIEPNVKVNRWSVEAQVAPLYSYRNITSSSELNADFNNNESGLVSYSNAIKVNYQTSKRLTIQMGIAYSVIGQTLQNIYIQQPASNVGLKYSSTNTSSRVNTSFGLINNSTDPEPQQMDNATAQYTLFNTIGTEKMSAYGGQNAVVTTLQSNADIIQRLQVIEIPIMARYYILTGKFNWHVASGLSTNILVGNDALLHNNNQKEKIGETANLKRLNYSGIVGTGVGYAIKKNVIITIEPTFKYYLNSISNTGIKVHPFSFGLYTGICYKL